MLRRHWVALAAALLFLLALAARWPGLVMYDSVTQYDQAVNGPYSDWHPPIMARTWALLIHVWPGTTPFFLIQMVLWWGGLALLARAVSRERPGAAMMMLAIGAFPLFLGWATVVLKDAQMAVCLVAAVGLIGWWRLRERPVPGWVAPVAAILIAYATLVRGNAAFATIPLGLALSGWFGLRRWWQRGLLALVGIGAVLAVSPLLNQRVMGAEASHNDRSLPLWDIVAIAHFAHLPNPPGISPEAWAEAERRGCYTPFFWNPYGEPQQCDAIGETLAFGDHPRPHLMGDWIKLVATHPIAYAEHRLGHFNSSLRFIVGMGEPDAIPPVSPEPNGFGLGRPATPGGKLIVLLARWTNVTPLGWPICWLAAGVGLLWALGRTVSPEASLARALTISALTMSGSFAVASIASDLRYHLWSMVAIALALAIGWRASEPARRALAGVVTLAIAAVVLAAHLIAAPITVPLPTAVPAATTH